MRDLYLLYRRWRWPMLALLLGLVLLGFVWAALQPKVFESTGVLGLSLVKQERSASSENAQTDELFANMPTLAGLVQGFEAALESRKLLGKDGQPLRARSNYTEAKGTLELVGSGPSPDAALETTTQTLDAASVFVRDQVTASFKDNLVARLARLRFDRDVAKEGLKRLAEVSRNFAGAGGDATTAAGLEARQVDPQAARSGNPGATSLRLELARLQTELARAEAMVAVLEALERDPGRLTALAGQAFQVRTLAVPGLSVAPASPRTLLVVLLAGVLGVLAALVLPLVLEAVREPSRGSN